MTLSSRRIVRCLAFAMAIQLGACASIEKVGPGEAAIHGRLAVNADSAWNRVKLPSVPSSQTLWTRDGLTLDTLRAWSGLKDGDLIAPNANDQRPLVFRADQAPDQVAALFEGYYARGGNLVTVDKIEPASFLAGSGTRLLFKVTNKDDSVKRSGLAYFAVRGGELHALVFTAPTLAFFPRYQADVERLAQSARLR